MTIAEAESGSLSVSGASTLWHIDTVAIRDEMRRRGLRQWQVRFADLMSLDAFFNRFTRGLERHPATGAFGLWHNGLGRWDWWDLGGRFDGAILGEERRRSARGMAQISSGPAPGRAILAQVEDALTTALGQEPAPAIDLGTDRNIELVATLLQDARVGRPQAFPGSLVLPPGAVEDRLRWLGTWPRRGPAEAFAWLGLPPDAAWEAVVTAAYARFEDHWAAGIAYHH